MRGSHNGTGERGERGKRVAIGWSWWGIVVGVLAAAGAGTLVAYPWILRLRHPSEAALSGKQAVMRLPEDLFDAPAFSPQATADDLKQESLRTAEDLLQAYPDRPEAMAVAARLQYSLGHSDEARSLWLSSCEIDPQFANAYFALGTIAKDSGDFSEAVEMFQKVVALAPSDYHTPPLLAESLMALGRTEEAVVVLDRHVHTQPVSAPAVVDLGLAYVELKDYEKARQTLEAVTRSYPDDPRAFYALALLYAKLGEKQRAQESMQQFQRLSSVDDEAIVRDRRAYEDRAWMRDLLVKTLSEAGEAYHQFGRNRRAEAMWLKTAILDEKHVACRRELLALYEHQGRVSEAIEIAAELSQLEPDNPDHWFNLAVLQARVDRLEDARAAILHALRLDPDDARYRQVFELCRRGGRE